MIKQKTLGPTDGFDRPTKKQVDLNLRKKPGEQQVSVYFRKQTGPESQEGSEGVILRCKGGNEAVTALVEVMNRSVGGGKDAKIHGQSQDGRQDQDDQG